MLLIWGENDFILKTLTVLVFLMVCLLLMGGSIFSLYTLVLLVSFFKSLPVPHSVVVENQVCSNAKSVYNK